MVTVDLGAAPPVLPQLAAPSALPVGFAHRPRSCWSWPSTPAAPPAVRAARHRRRTRERLDDRLGRTPGTGDRLDLQAVFGRLRRPRATPDKAPRPSVGDADRGPVRRDRAASPARRVAVDLDVTVGDVRVRAWHRERAGGRLPRDGRRIVFELSWFPAERLGRGAWPALAVLPEHVPTACCKAVPSSTALRAPAGVRCRGGAGTSRRLTQRAGGAARSGSTWRPCSRPCRPRRGTPAGARRDISGTVTMAGVVPGLCSLTAGIALRTHCTEAGDRLGRCVARRGRRTSGTELAPVPRGGVYGLLDEPHRAL